MFPAYLYSLFGQQILGFIYGGVFGVAGLLFGAFLQGFIQVGKGTLKEMQRRDPKAPKTDHRRRQK